MTKIKQLQRLSSGVPGLDFILAGGLFESSVYIIQGIAGSGKTILANQICFHHAAQNRRTVYFTLLTESHDRMLGFLQPLAFFDAKYVPSGVNYVSGYKILEAEGLPGVLRSLRDLIAQQRPAIVVVDGLVSAEEIAASDTAFKKFLHELQTVAGMFNCTALLLANTESSTRLQAEHTMVDGIIDLRSQVVRLKAIRSIEVSKLRGAGQLSGTHTLEISDAGIRVLPRVEAVLAPAGDLRRQFSPERLKVGIPGLEAATGGGIPRGSNTMVLGPSGIGKTILGMQYLNAGAAVGEKGMLFTFYEQEEKLIAKARRLGMTPFADAVARGDIKIVWQSSVEAKVDRIGNDLVRAFEELQPRRVFVDGIHGFQQTLDPLERIQDFFAAVCDYFVAKGATFLFTSETQDLIGEAAIRPPFTNASRMCHNIFVLRYTELRGRLTRVWSVMKMRDSTFDPAVRVMTVEDDGVYIRDQIEDGDMLLGGQPRRADEDSSE